MTDKIAAALEGIGFDLSMIQHTVSQISAYRVAGKPHLVDTSVSRFLEHADRITAAAAAIRLASVPTLKVVP
jgi:hypothetical protein